MDHYTMDNTQGYSQEDLGELNAELTILLADIEPYTDAWYEMAKRHADTVANR